jgi:hypothetical protein
MKEISKDFNIPLSVVSKNIHKKRKSKLQILLKDKDLKKIIKKVRKYLKYRIYNGYEDNSFYHEYLGCTHGEIVDYLNNNPYGFKLSMEGLDIDHIIPLSSATTKDELIKLLKYTNLQLLPSKYNQHIKRTKEWNVNDFELWLSFNPMVAMQ